MSGIHVMELRCPECGVALTGLYADRVFTCAACRVAIQFDRGHVQSFPLRLASEEMAESAEVVWLPFWQMAVDLMVRDPEGQDVLAGSVVAEIRQVFVPAFYEVRPGYFGNPGLDLTENAGTLSGRRSEKEERVLVGGERTMEEASRYPRLHVLGMLDRQKDVTGFDIRATIGEVIFLGVPFVLDRERWMLHNLTTGNNCSAGVMESLPDLLLFCHAE